MKPFRPRLLGVVVPALVAFASVALGQTEIPLENWKVPLYNGVDVANLKADSGTSRHAIHALSDIGQAVAFQAVTPCRVVNTRNAIGPFGGPSIPASGSRDFDLNANPACPGIPAASAYSINVTAAETGGPGFLKLYPTGGSVPVVSTVNFSGPGQVVANAAIVPAGTGGSVTVVAGVSGANVIIDINGYFSANLNPGQFLDVEGTFNPFLGFLAGGVGYFQNNTAGIGYSLNSSIGSSADGSASVHGSATSSTGVVTGVRGDTQSGTAGASGVLGVTGAALANNHFNPAGVIGNSGDIGLWGVLGISTSRGVQGTRTDGAGAIQVAGVLGYSGSSGVHSFQDVTAGGTKPFVVPYEGRPEKQIVFVSTEADEVLTATRGRIKLNRGIGVIQLPVAFLKVTEPEGWTVQLTPIGEMAALAVMRMDAERGQIVVRGSNSVEVFYRVEGIRKGYKDFNPIQENVLFMPSSAHARMDPWPSETKRVLIQNKIFNEDGTPNLETASALGWTKVWEQSEKAAKEAAAAAAAKK